MSGNTREPGRSTSSRLLALLDAFTVQGRSPTLTSLAQSADLPPATAHRLLRELTDWGAVSRLQDGSYQIGMRLWELGQLAPRPRDLRTAARPFMEDLYLACHENVQLAVLDRGEALCIERISGHESVTTMTEIGGRLPLHSTGVGKIFLAFSPSPLLASVLEEGLTRVTPYTITMPGRLIEDLRSIRDTQLATSLEEMTLGASSVAAPVYGPHGVVIAALAIVVRSTFKLESLAPAVRMAALSVSRRLRDAVGTETAGISEHDASSALAVATGLSARD